MRKSRGVFVVMVFIVVALISSCSGAFFNTAPAAGDSQVRAAYDLQHARVDDVQMIGADGGVTVIEDAEDGLTDQWYLVPDTTGASVANIYDMDRGSRVIELDNNDTATYFYLGAAPAESIWRALWHNTEDRILQVSLNFNVDFALYVLTKSTDGVWRILYYTPLDFDRGYLDWGSGGYVHHGLGEDLLGSGWQTITRDLQADLSEYMPGVEIAVVEALKIAYIGEVPPKPSGECAHTIGFWKTNIAKAIAGRTRGIQIDRETLEEYLADVRAFYSMVFADIDLESAFAVLSSTSSDAKDLLAKQLLAAELNLMNGVFMDDDYTLTVEILQEAEDLMLSLTATREELLAMKDLLDAFNNNELLDF